MSCVVPTTTVGCCWIGRKALSANPVDLDCGIASATKQQESSSIEELSFHARTHAARPRLPVGRYNCSWREV